MVLNKVGDEKSDLVQREAFIMMLRLTLLALATIFFILIALEIISVPSILLVPMMTICYVGGYYYTQLMCNFFFSDPLTSNLIPVDLKHTGFEFSEKSDWKEVDAAEKPTSSNIITPPRI